MSTGLKANSDGSAAIQVGGTDVITLTSGGAATFVTSPTTVQAGTAAAPSITFSGDTNTGIYSPGADTIAFTEGGVESMRIDSAGNVGIGTTSPQSLGGGYTTVTINGTNGGGIWMSKAGTAYGYVYADSTGAVFQTPTTTPLIFQTNNAERARITSGGEFLVAKTTTSDTTIGAVMQPSGRIAGTMAASTNSNDTLTVYSTGAGAYRFYVGLGGTIFATSTTISAISDIRLKENIQDLDVGLDKIMALKPRKFDWKEGKGKNIKGDRGWIAQEFEQVFPDMIGTWKDEPPEGEEPYKSVGADLIPVLVKAIQEQQAMIDELKAKVAALEGA